MNQCSEDGCGGRVLARGRCSKHYAAWRKRAPDEQKRRHRYASPTVDGRKRCNRCGEEKPISEYQRAAVCLEGLAPHCKACERDRHLVRREQRLEYQRARWHATMDDPIKKARKEETNRLWLERDGNRDRNRQAGSAWQRAHPDKRAEATRRWAKNPLGRAREVWNARNARRRAARKSARGSHTMAQFYRLCERLGWLCSYCGLPLTRETATRDHKVALTRGGTDYISNIAPACGPCNSSKHTLSVREFKRTRLERRKAVLAQMEETHA